MAVEGHYETTTLYSDMELLVVDRLRFLNLSFSGFRTRYVPSPGYLPVKLTTFDLVDF